MRRLGEPRRRRAEHESTIPLINVVFLLLVFFLVAGTLSAPRDPSVELARAAAFDPAALDPRAVYVDAAGALRVAGRVVDASAAVAAVRAAAAAAGGTGAAAGGDGTEVAAQGDGAAALIVVPDRTLEAPLLLTRLAELRAAAGDLAIRILTERPVGSGG
ncbi:biopolymer transporter ExbD [Acuticoccus yangtzensis]|uniref:biopolymer transporter ExbD n=1 Tax=Acuticoccus yangtzensis TaxID=1443441 RepID=UPI0009495FC9|nr:biopolymer transporter ExbD [Acuticoccus yangtzensis]ORE90796.1 biopolymer transport protein ExbD/TolR [Stappia sp. 22II-S9-Z10]